MSGPLEQTEPTDEAGLSEEVLQFQSDCRYILEKAKHFASWPKSAEMGSWPEGYAVSNAGTQSRQKAISEVKLHFPFLADSLDQVAGRLGWEGYALEKDAYESLPKALLLKEIITDTSQAPAFSAQELDSVASGDIPIEFVEDRYDQFFNGSDESSPFGGCNRYLLSEGLITTVYSNLPASLRVARENLERATWVYIESSVCESQGYYLGKESALGDFVSDLDIQFEEQPRNPFLEPFRDENTQGIAEFTWCYNLGLKVNDNRTGCD